MVAAYQTTLAAFLYSQIHEGKKNFSSTKNCAFDTKLLIMKLYRLICMELPSDILYLVKLCWQNCNERIGT